MVTLLSNAIAQTRQRKKKMKSAKREHSKYRVALVRGRNEAGEDLSSTAAALTVCGLVPLSAVMVSRHTSANAGC